MTRSQILFFICVTCTVLLGGIAPPPSKASETSKPSAFVPTDLDILLNLQPKFFYPMHPMQFEALDRNLANLRNASARLPSGVWQLTSAYDFLTSTLVPAHMESDFQRQFQLSKTYQIQYPASPSAIVLRALVIKTDLWRQAGATEPHMVPFLEAPQFEEPLTDLRRFLLHHRKIGQNDPHWHYLLAATYLASKANGTEIERVALTGLQKFPGYLPLLRVVADFYSPNWHDDPAKLEEWIQKTIALTFETVRTAPRAQIHWHLAERTIRSDGFKTSPEVWKTLRQAYEDWYVAFPSISTVHHLAYLACQAGDFETVGAQLPRLAAAMNTSNVFEGRNALLCSLMAQTNATWQSLVSIWLGQRS